MKLKIGFWIAYSDYGLWMDSIDIYKFLFNTKKEAIKSIAFTTLDPNRNPKIKRITQGKYCYYPKNCDTGKYDDSYIIEKVTNDNIERLSERFSEDLKEN